MEDFNLTNAEAEILEILLKSKKSMSVKNIIDTGTTITRYYIYEVLSKLQVNNLVTIFGNKPKKYSSTLLMVEKYIKKITYDKKKIIENLRSNNLEKNLQAYNFNDVQRKIFTLLMKKELNINQIATALNKFFKDNTKNPTSLIERYLKIMLNSKFIKRFRKRKTYKYSYYARPIQEINRELINKYEQQIENFEKRINEFMNELKNNHKNGNFLRMSIEEFLSQLDPSEAENFLSHLPIHFIREHERGIEQAKNIFIKSKKDK